MSDLFLNSFQRILSKSYKKILIKWRNRYTNFNKCIVIENNNNDCKGLRLSFFFA